MGRCSECIKTTQFPLCGLNKKPKKCNTWHLSFDLLLRLSTEAKTPSLRKYLPMCSRWRRSGNECWWFNSWKLHWVNSIAANYWIILLLFLSHFCPSLLGLILICRIISIPFGVSWRMSATITIQLLDVILIPLGPLKMDGFGHLWLVKDFHPLLISALKNYQYVPIIFKEFA